MKNDTHLLCCWLRRRLVLCWRRLRRRQVKRSYWRKRCTWRLDWVIPRPPIRKPRHPINAFWSINRKVKRAGLFNNIIVNTTTNNSSSRLHTLSLFADPLPFSPTHAKQQYGLTHTHTHTGHQSRATASLPLKCVVNIRCHQ